MRWPQGGQIATELRAPRLKDKHKTVSRIIKSTLAKKDHAYQMCEENAREAVATRCCPMHQDTATIITSRECGVRKESLI